MTGLAIVLHQPVHPPTGLGSQDKHDLRRSGIWFPDVPPPRLNLNEGFLVAPDAYTQGFAPLFWTCFGGRGGIHLKALEKITIMGASGCIHFSFTNPEVPYESRSFGRVATYTEDDDETEPVELRIDGPGGEVIDKVELCQELFPTDGSRGWLGRQGCLTWFKVIRHPSQPFGQPPHAKGRNRCIRTADERAKSASSQGPTKYPSWNGSSRPPQALQSPGFTAFRYLFPRHYFPSSFRRLTSVVLSAVGWNSVL